MQTHFNSKTNESESRFMQDNHMQSDKHPLVMPIPDIPDGIDGFVLDTKAMEKEYAEMPNGADLSRIASIDEIQNDTKYWDSCPHFRGFWQPRTRVSDDILETLRTITSPASKLYLSVDELAEDVAKIYQICHHHYVLGKRYDAASGLFGSHSATFPEACCKLSADNVLRSTIEHGLFHAAFAYNSKNDHAYLIFPFVMKNSDFRGTIVADPASDIFSAYSEMLGKEPKRNLLFIASGDSFEYNTVYFGSANLFPDFVFDFGCMAKSPKTNPGRISQPVGFFSFFSRKQLETKYNNGEDFISRAHENPLLNSEFIHAYRNLSKAGTSLMKIKQELAGSIEN